ncbi:hypothetical protein IC229_09400 [Spirosoma sp. BT702]|uniref:Fibronectin type-III domain-containing protein n=1 Tax=Spirosoma profusum TaxID=2771354 RepID=A0A926XUS9_9BACT|nr:putative Ig domain-containing protein [Spirosoma profusum]MBD2700853.1 hypothetical protein [Spirosoma profusum]
MQRQLPVRASVPFLLIFLGFFVSFHLRAQTITTVAGSNQAGDGGPATSAQIGAPAGIAVDNSGNLYIADVYHHRIRKVATNGTITTVAGTGSMGFSGDGGQAVNAQLANPQAVAVDASGNLYIADSYNYRVRKVAANGIISTIAGTGTPAFSGDGGLATNAQFGYLYAITLDSNGNIYLVDPNYNRVRKITTGGIISTVAGSGSSSTSGDGGLATNAGLNTIFGVAIDNNNNLYISEVNGGRVRKVNTSGIISTYAGGGSGGDGGQAINASINGPSGLVVDANGNLFITSYYRIRKVTAAGIISTVAGNGTEGFSGDGGQATSAMLYGPRGVAVDGSGNLYIADQNNNRIRKVNTSGIISTYAGNGYASFGGDGGQATNANLFYPQAVAIDGSGNFYIADASNVRIRKVAANGIITTIAGTGTYGFSGDGGVGTSAQIGYVTGLAVDAGGNVFFADQDNQRIRKITPAGIISTVVGTGSSGFSGDGGQATNATLSYPSGVAIDASGNLYIADQYNNRIRKVTTNGIITTIAGTYSSSHSGDGGPAINAALSPYAVSLDGSGNLYIVDRSNRRVRKITMSSGIISTVAGNGAEGFSGDGGQATNASLSSPSGVAVDASGTIYIADQYNQRIRKVSTNGIISTLSGNGTIGSIGDGGPVANALLNYPAGLAVDATNNIYITDSGNFRIRKVSGPASVNISPATPVAVCSSGSISLTATAVNFTPTSFSWTSQPTGISVSGASPTFTVPSVSVPTTYTLTVTATDGTSSPTASVTLTVNPAPTPTLTASGTLTCAQTSVTLTAGGGTTYQFSGPGVVSTSANVAVVNAGGTFSVTVTSASGCTASQTTTVFSNTTAPPASLSVSGTLTCAQTSVSLTAEGGVTYQFAGPGIVSQSGNVATVDQEGIYSTTVTGANGCTATQITIVQSSTALPTATLSASGTLTCSQTSVTLTAGDGSAYQFSGPGIVSQSGNVAVVNVGGTYSVTVTSANGCNASQTTTVASNTTSPTVTLSASGTLTCAQTSATLTAGGGATYQFSGPGVVSTSANVAVVNVGGAYSVTATGTNGCTASQSATVASNTTTPTASLSVSGQVNCSQTSVTLTAGGGSTYQFNGPGVVSQSGNLAVVNTGGSYSVTVTGSNGCTATQTTFVFINTIPPTASLSTSGTLTCAQTSVTLTAGSGTSYQFSGPGIVSQSNNVAVVNVGGTYSVTVSLPNGCTAATSATVFANTLPPTATLSNSGTLTCAQASVTLTAGGGTTYQFSGPGVISQSGNVAVVNKGGTYSVIITSANGCSATQTTTVFSNTTAPTATLSASGTLTCSQTSVTLTAGGGSTYQFGGPGVVSQSGNVAVVNQAGVYSVAVTGANGCSASTGLTISYLNCPPTVANPIPAQSATVNQAFSMSIAANTFIDPETPNSLTLSVSGLPVGLSFIAPATISGIPSTTTGSPFSVTITATDPGGLTVRTSFNLTVNPAPTTPINFTITSVNLLSCSAVTATQRTVVFNPIYGGLTGQPISFSVVNEQLVTSNPGPYQITLYTDNPVIQLRAIQQGSPQPASYSFNWLAACSNNSCTQMVSVKAGNWNDQTVWSCGRVPVVTDVVTLNHAVSLPASYVGQAQKVIYGGAGRLLPNTGSRLRLAVN